MRVHLTGHDCGVDHIDETASPAEVTCKKCKKYINTKENRKRYTVRCDGWFEEDILAASRGAAEYRAFLRYAHDPETCEGIAWEFRQFLKSKPRAKRKHHA